LVVSDTSQGVLSTLGEVSVFALSEGSAVDADGDGLWDSLELKLGSDPNAVDSDGDGIADGLDAFPTDPEEQADTDGDGSGDLTDNAPLDPTQAVAKKDRCNAPLMVRAGTGEGGADGANKVALMNVRSVSAGSLGLSPKQLPARAEILAFDVDVSHPSLGPGSAVTVTIDIPCGITDPLLYKIIDGHLYSFDDLGIPYWIDTRGSGTVAYTLTDGDSLHDEDRRANGIVVDPVVIGQAPAATIDSSGSGGGGCALSPTQGRPEDFVLLFIPIIILIGIKWYREGIEIQKRGDLGDGGDYSSTGSSRERDSM
jgi:hypothetical protein